MRRTTIGLLALALALTGCGRDSGGGAPEAARDVNTSAPANATIKVWAMGGEGEKLPQLAKEFEAANPGAKIEVTAIPWTEAHDKIASAIAAGTTPDVSLIGTTWMAEFAKTGAIDPVPGLVDKSKFFPAALEPPTVDDTLYGVPWYVDTRVLFYRTDLLEKAGLSEPPKTWEELKSAAEAMQDKAGAEHGIYLPPGKDGSSQHVMPLIWQQGGDVVGADGKFTLDTPEAVKAMEYYKSFFTDKVAPTAVQPGDAERWFIKGDLGFQITGPWMVNVFKETGGAGFEDKFAVAPLPAGPEGNTSMIGGADLVVFKDSKVRDAAWKFVDWLTEPAVQVKWFQLQNGLPSVQSAWEDPVLKNDEKVAPFGEQLKATKAQPALSTFEQVNMMLEAELEKLVVGGVPAAEVAKAMQSKADRIGTGS